MRAVPPQADPPGPAAGGDRPLPRAPRPWRQEALFVLLAFAAASAVPFLPAPVQERYAAQGFGAPPLLMLALATVAGAGALWSLRTAGFFAFRPGVGLVQAVYFGALAVPVAVAIDLVRPFPAGPPVGWPQAWLFYPSLAVVAVALLQLTPLALLYGAIRRAWPAMLLTAAAEPGARILLGAAQPPAAAVAPIFAVVLAELLLLRRHGILAALAFRLTYDLGWHVLWGGGRLALGIGGP